MIFCFCFVYGLLILWLDEPPGAFTVHTVHLHFLIVVGPLFSTARFVC